MFVAIINALQPPNVARTSFVLQDKFVVLTSVQILTYAVREYHAHQVKFVVEILALQQIPAALAALFVRLVKFVVMVVA